MLVLAALALAGCTEASHWLAGERDPFGDAPPAGAAPAPAGIEGRIAWHGDQSEVQGTQALVARTPAEWERMWALAGEPPPGPLPEGWMAVGVFVGTRPTAGYRVEIEERGMVQGPAGRQQLRVGYRVEPPPPDAMTAQVLTSPWAIRLLDETDASIEVVEAE